MMLGYVNNGHVHDADGNVVVLLCVSSILYGLFFNGIKENFCLPTMDEFFVLFVRWSYPVG